MGKIQEIIDSYRYHIDDMILIRKKKIDQYNIINILLRPSAQKKNHTRFCLYLYLEKWEYQREMEWNHK